MNAFLAGASRVLACWMIFGYLSWQVRAAGLPEAVAVIVAGVAALALNAAWRQRQRGRLIREHQQEVEHDETIRQIVREKRRDEGDRR